MVKKSIWAVCSVALLALAFGLPASAQDAQHQGSLTVPATQFHVVNTPEVPPPSTIFSNLGVYVAANCPDGNGHYTGCSWIPNGWLLCGTSSGVCTAGDVQYVAVSFKPKVNATMHHAEMPVQTYAGTSASFTASVQADCAGAPCGVYLQSKHTTATTAFYTCCGTGASGGLVVGFPAQALTAATQYWIVADTTNAADTGTADVWAMAPEAPYTGFCTGAPPCTYFAGLNNNTPAVKVY
jgi:hypothetical protein